MATKEEPHKSSEEEEEEEDDEEEEEEGAESSDEDEEPKLKYRRLGSSVADILKGDEASCMAVHEKFLVSLKKSKKIGITNNFFFFDFFFVKFVFFADVPSLFTEQI